MIKKFNVLQIQEFYDEIQIIHEALSFDCSLWGSQLRKNVERSTSDLGTDPKRRRTSNRLLCATLRL